MPHHHAYLVEGALGLLPAIEKDARARFGFESEHDPDVQVSVRESFGIAQSRELSAAAALKSVENRALFIVGFASITTEAQQALLKLFEEPPSGTQFVVLAPRGILLPTLISRFLPYPKKFEEAGSLKAAQDFLSKSVKERSAFIAAMLKDEEGARGRVREFCDELELSLHGALEKAGGEKKREFLQGLAEIEALRPYVSDRAPSLKMILEHLAASLPKC